MRNLRDTPTSPRSAVGASSARRLGARPHASYADAISWPMTLEAFVEPRFVDRHAHMKGSSYAHLFDRAGLALLDGDVLDRQAMEEASAVLFAVEEHLHNHAELREWDALAIHTRLLDVDPRGVRVMHFMIDPTRRRVAATAEVVYVCVDRAARRATPLPEQVRRRLECELQAAENEGTESSAAKS
jgi:acyl-CoA thioesterase FadM